MANKIKAEIITTEWAIERELKNLENYREQVRHYLDSPYIEHDAAWILHYADSLNETARKITQLREKKDMLEYLSKEE